MAPPWPGQPAAAPPPWLMPAPGLDPNGWQTVPGSGGLQSVSKVRKLSTLGFATKNPFARISEEPEEEKEEEEGPGARRTFGEVMTMKTKQKKIPKKSRPKTADESMDSFMKSTTFSKINFEILHTQIFG